MRAPPKMDFDVREVRGFLSRTGYVLTVRGYDYRTIYAAVPSLGGIQIMRKKICEITTPADLAGFLPLSGFRTVAEWWRNITRFCKGKMYLYRVTLIKKQDKQKQDSAKLEQQRFRDAELVEIPKQQRFRDWDAPTPAEDYNVFAGTMQHPHDIRDEPTDPALVNLQPFKDAAKLQREQKAASAAEAKRARMRKQQADNYKLGV